MRKFIVLFIVIFFSILNLPAQKAFKPLKSAIKAKNATEASKILASLEKDSTVNSIPKLYDLGKDVQIMINDLENEKIYLKQAYDTVKFFNSTYGIYDYIFKCDIEEQRLLAKYGTKMSFHKNNGILLHKYYKNLNAGGRFFFSKKNYKSASQLLSCYLDTPWQPIWGNDKSIRNSKLYISTAHLYEKCAFLNKDYKNVGRYQAITLKDTSSLRKSTLEYMCLAAIKLKDTLEYTTLLKKGLIDYQCDDFFFSHLADYYANESNFKGILDIANQKLAFDSLSSIAMEAKSLALMNLDRNEEALLIANKVLENDTTLSETYYYIGAIYCNIALNIVLPKNTQTKDYKEVVKNRKFLYEKAKPYLEKYRSLAPNQQKKWAPLLYRIYFILNDGKKFEEIENIIEKMK